MERIVAAKSNTVLSKLQTNHRKKNGLLAKPTMKPKKVFLLGLALLVCGSMMSGIISSGAWFSDSTSTSGHILTSGSLDLEVTGDYLNAANLEPGADYTTLGEFCASNIGTTSLKYRGTFESPQPLSNQLLNFLTLKVEQELTDGSVVVQEISGITEIETEGLRYYFKFLDQDPSIITHDIVGDTLDPGEETCYRMFVKLDASTPDNHQGQSIEFVLHLGATQTTNPGW